MSLRGSVGLLVAVLPHAGACDDGPAGPETVVQRDVIAPGGIEPGVGVTADAHLLLIDITTWGNPCTRVHHDVVDMNAADRVITITPYNEVELGARACDDVVLAGHEPGLIMARR